MTFTHKIKGQPDHQHQTVTEARDCLAALTAQPPVPGPTFSHLNHADMTRCVHENLGDWRKCPTNPHPDWATVHTDDCVSGVGDRICGTYDACWGYRVSTARSQRDLFKSYND